MRRRSKYRRNMFAGIPVDSTTFDLHRVWLGAGRMILENVANLDQLPERAQLVVAPMKVAAANGAPARIFALLPD